MARQLVLRYPANDEDRILWLLQDTENPEAALSIHEGLEDASLQATGCRVILLVPAIDIVLNSAHLPTRNRQRIRSALPFMMEDQLAQEIEQLHLAIGRRAADGQVHAAVVERRHMAAWLARLRAYDIEPDVLVPDVLCLPWEPGHWSLLQEAKMTLLRTAPQDGLAMDSENLVELLGILLENTEELPAPQPIDDYSQASPPLGLPQALADHIELTPHEAPSADALALLAAHYDDGSAINLLQGEYSRHEQFEKLWRPWRPALAMLLAIILITAGLTVTDYVHLRNEQQQLATSIKKIYLDAFPDARRVVKPRVQMTRGLAALRAGRGAAGDGFLNLLQRSGQALTETTGLELSRLSYRDGHLDLALIIRDLQTLDQLKQRLSAETALKVEIRSASARDGKVEASIQIREATS